MNRQLPNFDRLASLYRWMEWVTFGPYLDRCRRAFIDRLKERQRALILGDGDGRFTARLLQSNPLIQVDAIDLSPAMLRRLAHRAGDDASRVQTRVADLRTWSPEPRSDSRSPSAPYDLVVTHFFLDCLSTPEVRDLARRLRPLLAPDALWIVSEFAIPPGWFGRLFARPLIASLYLAFRLLTGLAIRLLPDHSAALKESGFTLTRRETSLRGLLISELWTPKPTAVSHNEHN